MAVYDIHSESQPPIFKMTICVDFWHEPGKRLLDSTLLGRLSNESKALSELTDRTRTLLAETVSSSLSYYILYKSQY